MTVDRLIFSRGSPNSLYVAIDTYDNIVSGYNATTYNGCNAFATDIGPFGITVEASGGGWHVKDGAYTQLMQNRTSLFEIVANFNGSPAYTQSGTTVSVNWNSHNFTALLNGSRIYLPIATGGLSSGWYTNFQHVDANNFTCETEVSGSNIGTLGTNTSETYISNYSAIKFGLVRVGSIIAPGITYVGKAANSRSIKLYLGGFNVATSANSSATFNFLTHGNILCQAQNKFVVSGSTTQYTVTDYDARTSITLSVAGDWFAARNSHIQFFG